MHRKDILKRVCTFVLCTCFLAGTVNIPKAAAEYVSRYPVRVADTLVYDDIESYEYGTAITRLGADWWDPGNNQNEYGIVGECDGQKAIYYEGEHDYTTFCSPQKSKLKGQLWIDVDIKFPEIYDQYRFQIGDFTHPDRATLIFYKNNGELYANGVQDPAGGTKSVKLTDGIPQETWFTLSVSFDVEKEKFSVYINGNPVGGAMNMNYKFACSTHGADEPEASFAKMSFAHRGVENLGEGFSSRIYLDNFGISYAKEMTGVGDIDIVLDKGEEYSLPTEFEMTLNDGTKRKFGAVLTPVSAELDTNTVGTYVYTAQIENYPDTIEVRFHVVERSIVSVDTVYESVYKNQNYVLPETIPANMSDGNQKQVPVQWETEADTSVTGTSNYYGTVEGYGRVTLVLEVLANEVLRADDVYCGVKKGEAFTPPAECEVILTNHKYAKASVIWDAAASGINTENIGKYEFNGTVEGYANSIKLHVTVYEYDADLEHFVDVLTEFYDNCLNKGRDRSEYFPQEYSQGYDPATPEKISENPHSPLFSMGISRETNNHALWPTPHGKRPLAVPATQGPLVKGLMGMSKLTGDSKYHDAVEEMYGYLINNYVDPNGHMLHWGDHILQQFDEKNLSDQVESDSYAYMVHQLECDYPEWDVLFSQNPEATARYIKAFWTGHFNNELNGIRFDTMEFTRHTTVSNNWDRDMVDNIFKTRYDWDLVKIHQESGKLTFVNAAADYVWAAVKLWQNTGDEDALYYARKLLWCYNQAANPQTGLVPFMFTDTGSSGTFIGDVYDPKYMTNFPNGRAKDSYSKVWKNPEKYGTQADHVNDSFLLNQGKCGGGSFYMPMMCFDVADIVGGEIGREIESWGISALLGFVNYTYDYKTGLGKSGMTDGTVLDDYKPEFLSYYAAAGRAQWPFTITSDMSWVLLDGYERTHDQRIWDCLRNVCMSFSIGDIGTAPGENVDLEIYSDSDDTDILLTLSRLYELTGNSEYYNLAKRIAEHIINNRFINGFFYKTDKSAYARMADPAPYAILYFVASARGESKMLPHYQGESFDFQTQYQQDNGEIDALYGSSLFNQKIVSEVLVSAIVMEEEELELAVGQEHMLNAETMPDDAEDTTLEWSVDNNSVCIVEDGYVKAIGTGTCIVTAEASSGVSASVKITVK